MDCELPRDLGKRVLKTWKFQRGGGGGGRHKPSGTEIPRGLGVKIKKKPSVGGGGGGGVWIFSGTAHFTGIFWI